ncbi:MAG TPA: thioredoxin domain-containing protein [Solirubrobacteraceae bacterium]|nr:thioredoxin domain-containing protein [Solirubrobacteraceae bacterium]
MDLGGGVMSLATIRSPPFALAGGWWIFLIFLFVFLFAIIFGYYTVTGSGINLRPYRRAGEPPESPPNVAHDITSDVRNWQRGTEGHHRRYRPAATQAPLDPEVAQALRDWRESQHQPHLEPPVGAGDHVRGPEGAQTVTLYLDLAAEPCRSAIGLVQAFSQERPLRMAIRHLPLADVHALALPAAEALEAAAAQGRFFQVLDILVPGFSSEAELLGRTAQAVPDPERLRSDVEGGRFRSRVVEHIRQATASGVHGVPEVFIDGQHYGGALMRDPLGAALDGREWRPGSRSPRPEG